MSSREIHDAKSGTNADLHNISSRIIDFRDPVVERVVKKFVQRSDEGFTKYGRTLHEERVEGFKDLAGYLNDVQEELMDAILYIQSAREELVDLIDFNNSKYDAQKD